MYFVVFSCINNGYKYIVDKYHHNNDLLKYLIYAFLPSISNQNGAHRIKYDLCNKTKQLYLDSVKTHLNEDGHQYIGHMILDYIQCD